MLHILIYLYLDSLGMFRSCPKIIIFLTIISIMVCCLAALGYNSKVSIEKEKIEVDAQSNFNQNNQ